MYILVLVNIRSCVYHFLVRVSFSGGWELWFNNRCAVKVPKTVQMWSEELRAANAAVPGGTDTKVYSARHKETLLVVVELRLRSIACFCAWLFPENIRVYLPVSFCFHVGCRPSGSSTFLPRN